MRLIEIKPECFLNMETVVMIERDVNSLAEKEFVVITTVSGEQIEIEQNFKEFMDIVSVNIVSVK